MQIRVVIMIYLHDRRAQLSH